MITDAQENNLSAANGARTKKKQDKANPMVINIDDGRLMPNTPRMRTHPKYRVYGGKLEASVPERMKWLAGALKQMPTIINSAAEEEVFDLGVATREDLMSFALEQFGVVIDPAKSLATMRKEVGALAGVDQKVSA
jgi:hypothetical protein